MDTKCYDIREAGEKDEEKSCYHNIVIINHDIIRCFIYVV